MFNKITRRANVHDTHTLEVTGITFLQSSVKMVGPLKNVTSVHDK